MSSYIHRTQTGKFALLISDINEMYSELEEQSIDWHTYDGGQPSFTKTEIYISTMREIKKKEEELNYIMTGLLINTKSINFDTEGSVDHGEVDDY